MDRARFEHAAVLLAKSLTNEMLDSLRLEWGNTNHDVLRYWRNEVLEAVASPVAVEPHQQEGHKPAPLVDCPTCAGSQYIRVDGQVEDCPNPNCYQGFVR